MSREIAVPSPKTAATLPVELEAAYDCDSTPSGSVHSKDSDKESVDGALTNGNGFHKNPRDPADVGAIPSTVPRRCSDLGWCVAYFAFTAAVAYLVVWVWPRGQPGALLKLADWQGEKCGLGSNKDKPLLFFCPHAHEPDRLQMWYPICVNHCPEGEVVICPKNLNHEPTTTTTTKATTTGGFYQSIHEGNNGGLPYPPYSLAGGYERYPQRTAFDYPYYRPRPKNYVPVIYPKSFSQDEEPQFGAQPEEPWGSPEMNYALPPAIRAGQWRDWAQRAPTATVPTTAPEAIPTGRRMSYLPLLRAIGLLRGLKNQKSVPHPNKIVYSDWRGNFTLYRAKSYASAAFVDMVCKPWEHTLEDQVQSWIDKTPLVNTWATLINSYWPLLVAAGTGVVMSYVYITLLRFRAAMLVNMGMFILVLAPLTTGAYFLWCWKRDGQCWGSTGDRFTDGVTALAGMLVGVTFMTISWHLQQDIALAIDCIEMSCKAVLETPSLKLEPVMALLCRGVVDFGSIYVAALILTCDLANDEVRRREERWIIPPQSLHQIFMLATVAFWCLWTNWIITAISDFVIMYTTELWVFTGGLTRRGGHAPCCSLLRGYFICLRYHFGTIILGSLIVGVAQPFRLVTGVLAGMVRLERNSMGIFSCFCSWMVEAHVIYLEPWCRNAYMDVALNALCFYESALHTAWVNHEYMNVVNILNGATWLFQLAGLGAITSLGHLQTCVIIKYYPGFEDPFSPDYVQNPFLLSLCGSAVAFIMAFPFMMIFDTVSDTILFAYIVQKMREEKQEEHTIYTCACGLVHTVDDFMGLGCLDQRQKDYSMPTFFLDIDETEEDVHRKDHAAGP